VGQWIRNLKAIDYHGMLLLAMLVGGFKVWLQIQIDKAKEEKERKQLEELEKVKKAKEERIRLVKVKQARKDFFIWKEFQEAPVVGDRCFEFIERLESYEDKKKLSKEGV